MGDVDHRLRDVGTGQTRRPEVLQHHQVSAGAAADLQAALAGDRELAEPPVDELLALEPVERLVVAREHAARVSRSLMCSPTVPQYFSGSYPALGSDIVPPELLARFPRRGGPSQHRSACNGRVDGCADGRTCAAVPSKPARVRNGGCQVHGLTAFGDRSHT